MKLRDADNQNAHLPSASELSITLKNVVKADRNSKSQLNKSRFVPYAKYWSRTPSGKDYMYGSKGFPSGFVRVVRDEPHLKLKM